MDTERPARFCTKCQTPWECLGLCGESRGAQGDPRGSRELSNVLERSSLCGQNLVDHREIHERLHNTSTPWECVGLCGESRGSQGDPRGFAGTINRVGTFRLCGQKKLVDHREIHEVLHNLSNPFGMLGLVWRISRNTWRSTRFCGSCQRRWNVLVCVAKISWITRRSMRFSWPVSKSGCKTC